MVAMNVIYAASAYPFGKLSDSMSHTKLLALGLVVLIAADLVLASNDHWDVVLPASRCGACTWASRRACWHAWWPIPRPPTCAARLTASSI